MVVNVFQRVALDARAGLVVFHRVDVVGLLRRLGLERDVAQIAPNRLQLHEFADRVDDFGGHVQLHAVVEQLVKVAVEFGEQHGFVERQQRYDVAVPEFGRQLLLHLGRHDLVCLHVCTT